MVGLGVKWGGFTREMLGKLLVTLEVVHFGDILVWIIEV